ncbi:acetyl-CoA carboxylase, carboxyltransferase subunit beta [Clostridium sp. MSJ-4]|uniref:Acetyl-coenzyme A carboxylase carboxyl transferase subunit beta n=1 Tax=Clostridium simiarum TaxID=2841506 RepID=A0ABS6EZZ2_9CLOT|nr:acetyl-CoA carboxylase, carboxyltransferase subunit beta [Clostridium simiarum]MBU5590948.1 acetyl-CoA carboxylase, carboxyltransferase subunit beta [Clostridium simiarum]
MLKDIFKKRKYITINREVLSNKNNIEEAKPEIPSGTWIKCEGCGKIMYKKDVEDNLKVCKYCNYHFRLGARERISMICDEGSFLEMFDNITTSNPMNFPAYELKIKQSINLSGENEAVVTGEGKIDGVSTVIAIMDSNFIMGSMGSVVGEKITRAIEFAVKKQLPLIIFTASGGARMQEGIISLMQMAKISAALSVFDENRLLYITVLTDPTTGGVTASFAMQGDIILSEPQALIGFAGKRVIEKTINEKLPSGFQSAEFMLEKGFVDNIIHRKDLKEVLGSLLLYHRREE